MIEYKEKIIPEAFHGTSIENATKIIAEGFITIESNRNDLYLGDGVYFYEACKEHAYDWAEKHVCISPSEIVVICAKIDLGKCLELNNRKHVEWMNVIWELLSEKGIEPITDAVVINFFAKTFAEVDTVRASQIYSPSTKEKMFFGSKFYSTQRIIICVRNLKNILDYSLHNDGG